MSECAEQTSHTLTKQTEEPECILYHSICDKFETEQNELMVSVVRIRVVLWWESVAGTDSGNVGTHRVSAGVPIPSSVYLGVFTT